MKNILYALSLMVASSVGAQQYLPLKDFQDMSITSGGWSAQVVTSSPGSYTWTTSNQGTGTNYYAKASGWNGTSADNSELWLITAAVDLTAAVDPILSFTNAKNFNGPALALKISTDYSGTGAPSAATWTDITSSATWSAGAFAFVGSGNINLNAYNGQNGVYVAFVYTSTTADGASTWEIDDVQIAEFTLPTVTPIAAIQSTSSGDQSDMIGAAVTVGGRVTAIKAGSGFWIQDAPSAWSGIYVYDFGNNTVALGDSVLLSGTVAEYAPGTSTEKTTQIASVTGFAIQGSFNPYSPIPVSTLNANSEMYESVLIKVSSASCTIAPDGFNEWTVSDGSGGVKVDDFLYATSPAPLVGNLYNVTGVVTHSFASYKILPRDIADVELLSGVSLEENKEVRVSVYPNPSHGAFTVANTNGETIRIYNSLGQLVMTTKNNKITLKSGLYILKVGQSTHRVVVQ
jgi:predicted extracellular nuclease